MPYDAKTDTYICRRYRSFGTFEYAANFAEASSPIRVNLWPGDESTWQPIPYQVADARHDPREAERLIVYYFS
jgi:hypothetical protein